MPKWRTAVWKPGRLPLLHVHHLSLRCTALVKSWHGIAYNVWVFMFLLVPSGPHSQIAGG